MYITSEAVTKFSLSGNDFYIYSGENYITVKDMASVGANVRMNNGSINFSEHGNAIIVVGAQNTIYGDSKNNIINVNVGSNA